MGTGRAFYPRNAVSLALAFNVISAIRHLFFPDIQGNYENRISDLAATTHDPSAPEAKSPQSGTDYLSRIHITRRSDIVAVRFIVDGYEELRSDSDNHAEIGLPRCYDGRCWHLISQGRSPNAYRDGLQSVARSFLPIRSF